MSSRLLLPLPVCLLLGAALCPDGGGFGAGGGFAPGFPTPLPPPADVTANKSVTLHLDSNQRVLRFRLPVAVSPPSPSARMDHGVVRAARPFLLDLAAEDFRNDDERFWPQVQAGFVGNSFFNDPSVEGFVLGVALDAGDDGSEPLDVDLVLTLTAPADEDFDGVSDGVTVRIGTLEPLPR